MGSHFEVLPGMLSKAGHRGAPSKLGSPAIGECGPIAAQQLSEMFIFVSGFPVSWKRITQEEELFTMVRSES